MDVSEGISISMPQRREEKLELEAADSAAGRNAVVPRLVQLVEEVYSAVELSVRHQEDLWGIVILNSHGGPFQSDAIPPSLLPNLQAKMDASIVFNQMALERLQEMRALLVSNSSDPGGGTFSFPEAAPSLSMGEADFRQGGGDFGEFFTAASSQTASSAGPAAGPPSVCVGAGKAVPCSLKPVRPFSPLAPLKVPVRPEAYHTQLPSPELNRGANAPTVYTPFRGNTETRAMVGASVSPKLEVEVREPVVPPSFYAPSRAPFHFPEPTLFGHHDQTATQFDTSTGGTISGASSGSGVPSSMPQPPSSIWSSRGPLAQAQPPLIASIELQTGRDSSKRVIRHRRSQSPLAGSSRSRSNPMGESRQQFSLQPGADPSKDIPDDGYTWRKYGQKTIRNCAHERGYYRCSAIDEDLSTLEKKKVPCKATKKVQRSDEDGDKFNVYYRGKHTCRRGRASSSGSARGGQAGPIHPAPQPLSLNPTLATFMSRFHSPPLLGAGFLPGMEAEPPVAPAQQLPVEFGSVTTDTGTSDSSKTSDFVFERDQDLANLPDLPPFPSLQDSWEYTANVGCVNPVLKMEALFLDEDEHMQEPK